MASNLNAPHFTNADKAREYLEAQVWPHSPLCPHCGTVSYEHYKLKGKSNRPGLWKCKDCREPFTVTVGSLFHRSKVPLNVWLLAVYLLSSSKKGISSHQLHRTLGVTYKTAWFMSHRIREAMAGSSGFGMLGGGGKIVEADETFWGTDEGKVKGRRGVGSKMKVMSLVERGGKVRSYMISDIKSKTMHEVLKGNVDPNTHLMTDEAWQYVKPGREYFAKHSSVNHGVKEYARGNVTTNTIEGFFSIFKRGLIGTYQHIGSQHMQRYATEFDFRYNNRTALGINDVQRTNEALRGISNKRLTYRRINEPSQV